MSMQPYALWFKGFTKNQIGLCYERESPSKFPPPPVELRQYSGNTPQVLGDLAAQPSADDEQMLPPGGALNPKQSTISYSGERTPTQHRRPSGNCSAQWQGQDQVQGKDQEKAAAVPAREDSAADSPAAATAFEAPRLLQK